MNKLKTADKLKHHLNKITTANQHQLNKLTTVAQLKHHLNKLTTADQLKHHLNMLTTADQLTNMRVKYHMTKLNSSNKLFKFDDTASETLSLVKFYHL